MRDWLSREEWKAEKRYWREREATERAKGGRSLVSDEERATLPPNALRRLAYCRWMELRFTGEGRARGLEGGPATPT